MAKSIPDLRGVVIYDNDDSIPAGREIVIQDDAAAPAGGRVMSSLAGSGGLAHKGGLAGPGGGLAGS